MFDRFKRLDFGLRKTRDAFLGRFQDLWERATISPELWQDLEEILIGADVSVEATEVLLRRLQERVESGRLRDPKAVQVALGEEIAALLPSTPLDVTTAHPFVILVIGVNGVGKTTTIAKLAKLLKGEGRRVLIGAGDTFRAAAIDQLKVWGDRVGVDVIAHQQGADPGAVVFDTMEAGVARDSDVIIIDTAGRLHNKDHLMEELAKLRRIISRFEAGAPQETLLVLDATTGQNGLRQAETFSSQAGASGIVLTKLDGTSRGGIVIPIAREMKLPVRFIGTGETVDDFAVFDPQDYAAALLGGR